MRKIPILVAATIFLAMPSMKAQSFAVGANLGSEGAGLQFAVSISPIVQARIGYAYMPYSIFIGEQDLNFQAWDVHPAGTTTLTEKKIQGTGSLLFDFFPFNESAFHFSVGSMIGGSTMFQVTNTKAMPSSYHTDGMKYYIDGDRSSAPTHLYADGSGNYLAELRRNFIRPYVGIGFGNPFSKSVGVTVDIGLQYTGGIGFYTDPKASGNNDLTFRLDSEGVQQLAYDMRGKNEKKSYDSLFKYIDKLYKIPVMPVLRVNVMFGL